MNALDQIRRLWRHLAWADGKLLAALHEVPTDSIAWKEYSHVLGAEAVWLGRLEQRAERTAVWPTLSHEEAHQLSLDLESGYAAYLDRLDIPALDLQVAYVNSAGRQFTNAAGDILLHVALHGQYHRGKVNLLLREAGADPVPVDYIAFVRGAPAARSG